jgi:hypothetical protein
MNKHSYRGRVQAGPTEYLLLYRRGRIIKQGFGLGAWCLPGLDHHCLVPCTANNLAFKADQVTQENQGVEITGFAVWKIAKPEAAAQRFSFDDPVQAVATINTYLQDVVESAIRHRMANMTIEEILRKRATIILELKRELAYITDQWGLELDTIEIKNVRILSAQVFAHLQAPYREALRLQSETTTLQTEQEIAARQLAQKEAISRQESEYLQQEQVREHDLKQQKLKLEQQAALEAARLSIERQIEADLPVLAAQARVEGARRATELAARQHELAEARLSAEAESLLAEASNKRRADLALVEALPGMAGNLKIGEINITPEIVTAVARLIGKAA